MFLVFALLGPIWAEMTPAQKAICEQYTSIFENDTTELQYAYVEHMQDGMGYTSGRAGFTTATCDALDVVKRYTKHKANNPLAKFIPEMERLCKLMSDDVTHLNEYPDGWKECAKDPLFRRVQDEVSDDLYYRFA